MLGSFISNSTHFLHFHSHYVDVLQFERHTTCTIGVCVFCFTVYLRCGQAGVWHSLQIRSQQHCLEVVACHTFPIACSSDWLTHRARLRLCKLTSVPREDVNMLNTYPKLPLLYTCHLSSALTLLRGSQVPTLFYSIVVFSGTGCSLSSGSES